MGSGAPCVELLVVHDDCEGLGSSDGLGDEDDVGNDSRVLECEDLTCTSHSALDLVADHGDVELLGDPADRLEELHGCGDHTALSLDGLEDDGCGFGDTALGILEETLEVCDACLGSLLSAETHGAAVGVGVGHELYAGHDVLHLVLGVAVAGERHGSVAHTVVSSGECDYCSPAGGGLAQFDRRIGRIGTGRRTELHLGVLGEFGRKDREKGLCELLLHGGHEIQCVERCSRIDQIHHGLIDLVVVVAESERTRSVEEIKVAFPFHILHPRPLGLGYRDGELTRIAPGGRLEVTLTVNEVLVRILVH